MKPGVIPLHRIQGAPAEMSDDALVAACGTGETAALGALHDRHAASIRRFLARISGTDDRDLDDLVQTAFEMILHAARNFDGRSSVRTWMFGIENNTARHHVRTEIRRRRLRDAAMLEVLAPGNQSDPSRDVAERQRAAQLAAAIVSPPTKLRETFVLVYLEGLPGAEVAHVLGIREGAIWKRLHEARARLRVLLEGARE